MWCLVSLLKPPSHMQEEEEEDLNNRRSISHCYKRGQRAVAQHRRGRADSSGSLPSCPKPRLPHYACSCRLPTLSRTRQGSLWSADNLPHSRESEQCRAPVVHQKSDLGRQAYFAWRKKEAFLCLELNIAFTGMSTTQHCYCRTDSKLIT
jgi:hypothetical protein